jgi:formylglycine-generating enzyme required for sulfatase activity
VPTDFDVFLSHNSKDKPAVRELAKALRSRGLKVWLDEWELVPGRRWQEVLEETIRTVRSAAVVIGEAGFGPWETPEMRACLDQSARRDLPVIPVLLPGLPATAELPLFLQAFTWVDLREGFTENGLDRLQWGITGVKPGRRRLPAPPPPEHPTLAAYRTWAIEHYRGLSLLGVGGGDVRMSFNDVYVPLRFEQRPERLDRLGAGKEPEIRFTEALRDLQIEEIFRAPQAAGRQVLILGHPGAGKTTALLKILHLCLKNPESLGLAAGTVPVFLRLRRLTFDDLEKNQPLSLLLSRELADLSGGALPDDLGERLLSHGRLLLLLDGLDEISNEVLRAEVCKVVESALRDDVRGVVSCRYSGYGNRVHMSERFLPLDVRPLDAEQCRKLVELWFREAPRALREYPEAEARRAADRLTAALDSPAFSSQAWAVLVGSPLLLTLLCIIVLRGGQMPRQRVAFYDQSLRVLLERRNRLRQDDTAALAEPPLEVETALAVLRSLAWNLHQEEKRDDLTRNAAANAIEERLEALGETADGFQVLDWLHREAGILVDTASGEYGFLHFGLQEYLTALEIASRGEELLDDPLVRWTEEWWQEVLLLIVGLPGRRLFAPLMKRLLSGASMEEKLLRACLEEASEVDLDPLLACLKRGQPAEKQELVLRLLLGRTDPLLVAAATALQQSPDPNVAALAERLVAEARSSRPASLGEAIDLVLLPHSADQEGAEALATQLGQAGLRIAVAGNEPLAQGLFSARAVAVLWGPGGQPAWEVDEMRTAVRLFSRRQTTMLAFQLPGSSEPQPLPEGWKGGSWIDLRQRLVPSCVTVVRRALAGEWSAAVRKKADPVLAGEPWIDPLTGIRFLWIPGGRFRMGDTRFRGEQPSHWVRISPFWLGETPVTNQQYAVFLEQTGAREPACWRDPRFSAPGQPVVGVSWEEAVDLCHWLSKTAGQNVLLPSEAQWEFAARGTDDREYPWGKGQSPDATRACFGLDFRTGQPAPVGSYPAGRGPFGTLDQAGNVWEWCRDAWDEEAYVKRLNELVDPVEGKGLESAELGRALRGGCWVHSAGDLRASGRRRSPAESRSVYIGFRVASAPSSLDD